jgi:hypothetical protein
MIDIKKKYEKSAELSVAQKLNLNSIVKQIFWKTSAAGWTHFGI